MKKERKEIEEERTANLHRHDNHIEVVQPCLLNGVSGLKGDSVPQKLDRALGDSEVLLIEQNQRLGMQEQRESEKSQ